MKLLVMGAGYVGMALLRSLQSQHHEIFITTTTEERVETLKSYGKHVLLLHPNEDRELQELISLCDAMVILVAPKNSSYEQTYLDTAKRISSAVKDRKTPLYILYTSSTSICEGSDSEWVTEELELYPKSENAKILVETEREYLSCKAATCILRLGGIYGPGRELIDRARHLSGKEISGTGNEPTNHIHLEDVVASILFCVDNFLVGIYHIVNNDHPDRKELYSGLCAMNNIPCPIWKSDGIQSIKIGYRVSNCKIMKAGFVFKHPTLESGMREV